MTSAGPGGPISELPTPALTVDLDALQRNVQGMADWAAGKVALRPHAKAHKCVQIAHMQINAGAVGVTTATVAETVAMARAGIAEVLLANQVVDPDKLRLLARAARETSLIVALDDVQAAAALSETASRAGANVGVLIEVDVGMGRGGVRDLRGAHALAERIAALDGVELRGVMGYEGHAVLERDRERRAELSAAAMALLGSYVDELRAAGHRIEIVSAGGTNTHDLTASHPWVTELQAGTYALMDTAYAPFAPRFEPALGVLGAVISRHGDRVVLDCGTKTIGTIDIADPVPRAPGLALREVHEEHALLDILDGQGPALGDRIELIAPYCGGTANLNDAYHVVRDDVAVDVWPIVARGAGR